MVDVPPHVGPELAVEALLERVHLGALGGGLGPERPRRLPFDEAQDVARVGERRGARTQEERRRATAARQGERQVQERRVGLLKDLLRAGLVERRDSALLVPSPAVLGISAKLTAKGIDLDDVAKAKAVLERHLGRAAKELTALATARAKDADSDLASVVNELRPLVMEGVRVLFAQAMQRELRELATSGRAPRPARRGR